jgi:putative MATE family efflux protein
MSTTEPNPVQKTADNQVTSGPIVKTVFNLAIPVVLSMLLQFVLAGTNIFWVGKISPAAQDAVTTAQVVIWTLFALSSLVSIGVTALVSRYVGAGDRTKAAFYAGQGMSMGLLFGIIVSIPVFLFTPEILRFMGTSSETAAITIPYLRVLVFIGGFLFLLETVYAIFRASGNTKIPAITFAFVVTINMILDPLLIFGYGPFPELGVTGAAVATLIAEIFGCCFMLVALWKGKTGLTISRHNLIPPKVKEFLRIGRIGLPIATQQSIFVLVYWFLIQVVHKFGEPAAAAMGIGNRMESFSYLTCHGFSVAAATLVGQNLGAQKPERGEKSAWVAVGLAIGLTSLMAVLFILIPQAIATLFTDDPAVIAIATDYLIILGFSQVMMALEIVLEGAFSGAGDTLPPMIVMIPGAVIRVPLAWYLCFDLNWGINGVWWTLTITTLVKASILALWFRLGRWKKKQV